MSSLGLQQTYVDAQRIVTALQRAETDPTYFDSAVEILNSYVEPERTIVINKAIALGAEGHLLLALSQSGETIVIEDTGPVIHIGSKRRSIKWAYIGVGALGIIGAIFAYKKYRARRAFV